MATGFVRFLTSKGQSHDGSKDMLAHISAVERAGFGTLSEDQRVSFEVEQDRSGGNAAVDLRLG